MESGKNILIVENDPLLAASMVLGLEKEGFTIAGTAATLTAATDLMRRKPVDLAVIDIQLDGPEDGVATALELNRIRWVPIIYITGNTPLEVKERLRKTFPAAFLEKPLRMRELSVQIDLALNNFHSGNIFGTQPVKSDHIFLPSNQGYIGVKLKEILYIKADRVHSQLYLSPQEFERLFPGKKYNLVLITINKGAILPKLPSFFYQLTRSFVINLNEIYRFDASRLFIQNKEIPIPEGKRKELMNILLVVKNQKVS
ncbi:response regulator transcription factor [Dyadobacter sp. CY343]|uniref:response regulator transcription factor n=1 Tax=Dyadobacter sp. CY343 TaxID=2907299 RepID=UPI001F43584B|nr:response regulator [Dyadobacter sp. CY343]MCE7062206.1 response regulator [Dyadobacter sp. CY343]